MLRATVPMQNPPADSPGMVNAFLPRIPSKATSQTGWLPESAIPPSTTWICMPVCSCWRKF